MISWVTLNLRRKRRIRRRNEQRMTVSDDGEALEGGCGKTEIKCMVRKGIRNLLQSFPLCFFLSQSIGIHVFLLLSFKFFDLDT